MAIRCDCRWERVELDPTLSPLLLRAVESSSCPAHPSLSGVEETIV